MAKKRIYSIKDELLKKSREAMLAAVEIYNNPNITFKAETFITLAIIAWTYLMHAYYKKHGVDYVYKTKKGKRTVIMKTKYGMSKRWELESCLKSEACPLEEPVKTNLQFLIGIRHEIEHQMTSRIDNTINAKLQACALNFNWFIKNEFSSRYGLDDTLAISIQFSGMNPQKIKELSKMKGLSENVVNYITDFESKITEETIKDPHYSYHILYMPISVNNRGKADSVIEFVKPTDDNRDNIVSKVLIKETEKKKYLPSQVVKMMQEKGYKDFSMHIHTELWKNNGKSLKTTQYGIEVAGKSWYWYQSWIDYVEKWCIDNMSSSNKTIKFLNLNQL